MTAAMTMATLTAFGRGENAELYVVPAPPEVVIDGSLDDWDLSAYVTNYVIAETRETQSARIAMMYDEEALYIGGVVRDSSPMMNRHDPLTHPTRAWDADVFQFFISLDPGAELPLRYSMGPADKSVDVGTGYLWFFTDREEPALAMYRGMGFREALRPDLHENGHIPGKHFEGAYRKADDGLSYTFEYRIPWETLAMKRVPRAGDGLAATMAVFWGTPDGLKTAGDSAHAWNVMRAPGFPWQAANCWGTLTFSPEGNIPRDRVVGHLPPEKPLLLTFTYELPRAGESTIQLFNEKNESVRILVPQQRRPEGVNSERWDGMDDHGRPLPPGRYTWRGQVHDPIAVEYRFSVHNAGRPPYPTDDNTGGWGGDHGVPQAALAINDGMILAWNGSEYGWGIIRTDLEGRKRWGSRNNASYLATDGRRLFVSGGLGGEGVRVLDLADSRQLNFRPGVDRLPLPDDLDNPGPVTGLACDGERIYVSYRAADLILVYDLEGHLLNRLAVAAPGRLAMAADGALLAISEGQVLQVASRESLVEENRDARPATGDQRVVIAAHLDAPQAIAVGADGAIYVSNRGGRHNVSVFDAGGRHLRNIGMDGGRPAVGQYDPDGMFTPAGIAVDKRGRLWVAEAADGPKRISVWNTATGVHVKEFFGSSDYFAYGYVDPERPNEMYAHHVIWEIDWDKGASRPKTTFWRKTAPEVIEGVNACGHNHQRPLRVRTADNGVQYMWGSTKRFKTVLQRREGDIYKPFAAILQVAVGNPLYRGLGLPVMDDDRESFSNGMYFWQDANSDQTVQADEIVRLPRQFDRSGFIWLDRDLSVYLASGHVLHPNEITDQGQPVYDFDQVQTAPIRHYGWRDDDGNSFTYANQEMVKRNADGDTLWRYGDILGWQAALGLPITGPGRLWGMTGQMGFAGDYFAMMTYFGVNHIFSRDGRYVAAVLRDRRLGGRGAYEGQPEGQGGQFVKLDINGRDRYFIIHGGQDTRVWEVKGLESIQTLPGGVYEHTAEMADAAELALAKWRKGKDEAAGLAIVAGRDHLAAAPAVGKQVDDDRAFSVRLAYDEANLYLQYNVRSPHPLVNAVPESELIFRGGNCLDLQIATDAQADSERTTPAPGDLRLLVTQRDGQPFAMLYRPRVVGFDGERIVLSSPTGSESFDRIELVEVGLQVAPAEHGFTATATVPLELIGWQPQPGGAARMDVGYIFGNATGTRAAVRAYWKNNSFTANVVDDIPNESRLEPARWGEAAIEALP